MSSEPQTDRESVQTSLEDAYKEMLPRLSRTTRMSPADREDVVQDACVRVLNARSPQVIRNPVWYLLRAARNLIIDRHRARRRIGDLFAAQEDWQEMAATALDPERILSGRERLEIIRSAIEKLPPRCAEALELHRFAGLSYPVIAQQMRISSSMVEKHIAEAMQRLGRALEEADG